MQIRFALSLLTAAALASTAPQPKVVDSQTSDLDRDGVQEQVRITRTGTRDGHPTGGDVIVLRRAKGMWRTVWTHRGLNPWKLQLADVDGDGASDIVVGVWKRSPKDPVMAKRVFVYYWNGQRLMPKWLGSRLSRRFNDFALADVDGDRMSELAALEVVPKGRHRISLYRWRSFGFEWLGCTPNLAGVSRLSRRGSKITAAGPAGRYALRYSGGKVSVVREGRSE